MSGRDDFDPCCIVDATGDGVVDLESGLDSCAECGRTWPHAPTDPACAVDDRGVKMMWCSDSCADAWIAADPARRVGWIAAEDLPAEVLGERLAAVGVKTGARPRMPS